MQVKKLFFLPLVLWAGAAMAQPVITGANFNPVAGDAFAFTVQGTPPASWTNSGANVTWDFSTASSGSGIQDPWNNCNASNICDSFPGTTIVYTDNDNGGLDYYANDAAKRRKVGNFITDIYTVYSDGRDEMRYPMTYQDSYTDSFAAAANHEGTPYYNESGYMTVTADGYGTMITPDGTYSNTLRVHIVGDYKDSVFGSGVFPYHINYYEWLVPGIHNAVYTVEDSVVGTYTTISATAIGKVSLAERSLRVYPNPATTAVYADFVTDAKTDVAVTLMDVTGRTIGTLGSGMTEAGQQHYSYPTTGLPRGIYYLRLQSTGTNVTRKVEVL